MVANNKISGLVRSEFTGPTTDPTIYLNGMWIFEQAGNVGLTKVFHNTIVLDREDPVSYPSTGIQLRSGSSGQPPALISNNLISNSISTTDPIYRAYALVDGNLERGILTSDYNLLFADGENGFLGSIGRRLGVDEEFTNDLEEFFMISETNENSVSFMPEFEDVESNDFSISPDVENPRDYVVPRIEEIEADILGNIRETEETYLGAYEGTVFLSINTISNNSKLTIYPNPALNFFSLEMPGLILDANSVIQLYNIYGQLVFEKRIKDQNELQNIEINSLKSGLYLVKFETQSQSFIEKLIIR